MENNKLLIKEKRYVIVSKDRKVIAKGVRRNRALVDVDDPENKQRILTYTSLKRAEKGFKCAWFYHNTTKQTLDVGDLEAIPVMITIEEIKQ